MFGGGMWSRWVSTIVGTNIRGNAIESLAHLGEPRKCGSSSGTICTIDLHDARNTFLTSFARNTFLTSFARNTFLTSFARNTFLTSFARNTFLTSFARNSGTQSVPIFLQDAAGFFLIEIQYYSSVGCLNAVIEVMDDVWFLGFVDIMSVSLNIHHLETLVF